MKLSFRKCIVLIILAAILIQVGIQSYYIKKIADDSEKRLLAYTNNTVKQLENNLDEAFKSIAYTATYFSINSGVQKYLLEEEPLEKYKTLPYVNDTCQAMAAMNSQIQNAMLFDRQGNCVYSYSSPELNAYEELKQLERQYYEDAVNNRFVYVNREEGQEALLCITPVYGNKAAVFSDSQRIGTVMLVIRPYAIMKVLEETGNEEEVTFFLLDPEGEVMASNLPEGREVLSEQSEAGPKGMDYGVPSGYTLSEQSEAGPKGMDYGVPSGYTYLEREVWGNQGFFIVGKINNRQVVKQYDLFRSQMLLSCVVMIGILLLIGWLFNYTIAHPIDRLIGEVAELETNRRKKQLTGTYHFQLTSLVDKMNEMLQNNDFMSRRIFETQQRLYEAELMKTESELYALRSQINPHFLFNTLQCMGGIALMNDQPVVADMASHMAEIFRYSIKEGDKVTVEEEQEFLKKYLYIMDVRFNGRFVWKMEIEEEILPCQIDKMILQPLVENAVYHGLEKRREPGGELRINGRRDGETLLFTVADNGGRIDGEQLRQLQETLKNPQRLEQEKRERKRIGIVNIQSRLKLMYGDLGGVAIDVKDGITLVTLRLPI